MCAIALCAHNVHSANHDDHATLGFAKLRKVLYDDNENDKDDIENSFKFKI